MAQPSPDAEAESEAEPQAGAEEELELELQVESSDEAVEPTASDETAPAPPRTAIADLFAATPRREPLATDPFGVHARRSGPPSRETFLTPSSTPAPRETFLTPSSRLPSKGSVIPGRLQSSHAAAARFDAGWHLLREGKAAETLAEWEAAMALDPDNRSYAVNVQKLRTKLQR
jgi:hypothetical protein